MLFPLAFLFSQLGSSAESTDDGGFCAVGVCIPRVMDGRTHLEAGAGRCFCCSNRRHAAEKPLATAPFPPVGSSSLTYRGGWAWCRKRSALLFFSQTNSASGRETDVRFQQALHHTTSRNKQGVRKHTNCAYTGAYVIRETAYESCDYRFRVVRLFSFLLFLVLVLLPISTCEVGVNMLHCLFIAWR